MDKKPHLQPIKKSRLYENAVDQIKSLILTKRLRPGERLPSERELAQLLSTGRPTIREALRILGLIGLIEIRLGDGTYVKEPNFLPYVESVAAIISSRLSLEDGSILKLWEVRKIFEMGIIELACQKMTPQRLHLIEECLQRMEENIQNRESFIRYGEQFHRNLAEATGNEFLLLLYQSLWDMIHRNEYKIISQGYRQGAHSLRRTLAADQRIYAALAKKDPEGAEKAMEEHLTSEEEILMAVLRDRKNHRRGAKSQTAPSKGKKDINPFRSVNRTLEK